MNPFQTDMIRMQLPEGMGSMIAVSGFSLHADEDGCITVPKMHVAHLQAQGLTIASAKTLSLPEKKRA